MNYPVGAILHLTADPATMVPGAVEPTTPVRTGGSASFPTGAVFSGSPNAFLDFAVRMVDAANFQWSLDDGVTWSTVTPLPASLPQDFVIPGGGGVSFHFPNDTYAADQTWSAHTGIAQWLDQSGENNHASQTNTDRQPVFRRNRNIGLSSARFDRAYYREVTGLAGTQCMTFGNMATVTPECTILAYARSNTAGTYLPLVCLGANAPVMMAGYPASSAWGSYDSAIPGGVPSSYSPYGAYRSMVQRVFAASTDLVTDGAPVESNGVTSIWAAGDAPCLGADIANTFPPNFCFSGDIVELLVYPRALSDVEISAVNALWRKKYARPFLNWVGDSMSVLEWGVTEDAPTMTREFLRSISREQDYEAWNDAQGGNTLALMADAGALAKAGARVRAQSWNTRNVYVLWGGRNDMVAVGLTTAKANLLALLTAVRALKYDVVCAATLASDADIAEADRQDFNAYLRSLQPAFIDIVMELGADPIMGTDNRYLDTALIADGVHPNTHGLRQDASTIFGPALANILSPSIPRTFSRASFSVTAFSNTTRPDPSVLAPGQIIFNTDDETLNVSDGTNWRDMDGEIT